MIVLRQTVQKLENNNIVSLQKQALKQSSISVFIREPITHAHDNTEFDDTTISTDNMIKMLSILVKDNYLVLVEGIPDIYLSNADFDKVLREPQLLKQIKQDMHLDNNFLIGRLGEEKDGVYQDNLTVPDLPNKVQGKELGIYEALQ